MTDLVESLSKLNSAELQAILDQREAEVESVRALLRAAATRERRQRRAAKESEEVRHA